MPTPKSAHVTMSNVIPCLSVRLPSFYLFLNCLPFTHCHAPHAPLYGKRREEPHPPPTCLPFLPCLFQEGMEDIEGGKIGRGRQARQCHALPAFTRLPPCAPPACHPAQTTPTPLPKCPPMNVCSVFCPTCSTCSSQKEKEEEGRQCAVRNFFFPGREGQKEAMPVFSKRRGRYTGEACEVR